jgi:hypothetical protein
MDHEEVMQRAYTAWHRACKRNGWTFQQPSDRKSMLEEHNGKLYAVLRGGGTVYQVYRVRNDGMLKGLKRWPKEIDKL